MKILVTGANGMLGSDLVAELLNGKPHEVHGVGLGETKNKSIPFHAVDMTDQKAISSLILDLKPNLVIHAAANVDADFLEDHPDTAYKVNTDGVIYTAQAAQTVQAPFFFFSSDYVFDGLKQGSYNESDRPDPLSIYGQSKYRAEQYLQANIKKHCIFRICWLFGANGKNFFRTILNAAPAGKELKVVNDQIGAPTYTKHLSRVVRKMAERTESKMPQSIYHIANSGATSWYEAAKYLLQKIDYKKEIKAINSSELDRRAKRPINSKLDLSRLKADFGIEMPTWQQALDEYWQDSLEKEWKQAKIQAK